MTDDLLDAPFRMTASVLAAGSSSSNIFRRYGTMDAAKGAPGEDDVARRIAAGVAQRGWFVIGVTGDKGEPPWCYSIGFTRTYGQPEVIVFGLPPEKGYNLI